jgi:hypothetical protein
MILLLVVVVIVGVDGIVSILVHVATLVPSLRFVGIGIEAISHRQMNL